MWGSLFSSTFTNQPAGIWDIYDEYITFIRFFLPQIRTEVLDGGIDRLVRGRAVKTAGLRGSLQLAKP